MKSGCFGAPGTTAAAFGAHAAETHTETQTHRSTENKPKWLLGVRVSVLSCVIGLTTSTSRALRGTRGQSNHRQEAPRHVGLERRAVAHRRVTMHGGVAIQPGQPIGLH